MVKNFGHQVVTKTVLVVDICKVRPLALIVGFYANRKVKGVENVPLICIPDLQKEN